MSLSSFTYTGSEALEMIKTTFPKTWENEIKEGYIFIKALVKVHNLSPYDAFQKYLRKHGSPANAICLLASLHVMIEQSKLSPAIKKLQDEQLSYGNQLIALEETKTISFEDKKSCVATIYPSKMNYSNELTNTSSVIPLSVRRKLLYKQPCSIDINQLTVLQYYNLFIK